MTTEPLVSVVLPAYKAEKTLERCIRSVIAQTWQNWEILAVNDCSPDGTGALLERLVAEDERIRVLKNEKNRGVSYSRNRGVSAARGEWIAFLDSDDLWRSDKLEKQMALVEKHPEASLFFTGSAFITEEGFLCDYELHVPEKVGKSRLLGQNIISCSSVLARRDTMLRFPMGNDAVHEDFAVWLRVLTEEPWAYAVDEPLLIYRVAKNSKSGNKLHAAQMTFATYREAGIPFLGRVLHGALYTLRGIRKFRAIRSSVTDQTADD